MVSNVLLSVASALVVAGCYGAKINTAPVARMEVVGGATEFFYPGIAVSLSAERSSDADGDTPTKSWEQHTCPDTSAPCPLVNLDTAVGDRMDLHFDAAHPHLPILVTLTVSDPRGASNTITRWFQITDQAPSVQVQPDLDFNRANRNHKFTVGRELAMVATPADPEGDNTSITWKVSKSPAGAHAEERSDPGNKRHYFRPDVKGSWELQATVDDGFKQAVDTVAFEVDDDLPPCIDVRDPELPVGALMVLSRAGGPRTFRVASVTDEFDAYPAPLTGDDHTGLASFRWSVGASSGATLEQVPGQITNELHLDPGPLQPGDRLAVRVDVFDRVTRTGCAPESPTCAPADEPECLSRFTWNVEVR